MQANGHVHTHDDYPMLYDWDNEIERLAIRCGDKGVSRVTPKNAVVGLPDDGQTDGHSHPREGRRA